MYGLIGNYFIKITNTEYNFVCMAIAVYFTQVEQDINNLLYYIFSIELAFWKFS